MSDIILKAENLSKQYRLGVVGLGTVGHDLNRFWHKIRGKEDPYLQIGSVNDRSVKASSDYVWALRDINFEIKRGEVLGIIGKNGAGKSTLLKILSRVTAPTTGSIKSKGRIASLLEVGTGMHPELTGRENIFLNGAILGMTKSEISSKIDEIIEFSGCEMYIDTPVKRYSSGMRVRLGFAVAAFLEPDILVVDEVLAVGDAEFQKKAIGKMKNISEEGGRTVLFVSHNMAAIKSLCTKTIVIDNGATVFEGSTGKGIQYYLSQDGSDIVSNYRMFNPSGTEEPDGVQVKSVGIRTVNGTFDDPLDREQDLRVEIVLNKATTDLVNCILVFKDFDGKPMFTVNNSHSNFQLDFSGENTVHFDIPKNFFNPGDFSVDFFISKNRKRIFEKENLLKFNIIVEQKKIGEWMGKSPGALKFIFDWHKA